MTELELRTLVREAIARQAAAHAAPPASPSTMALHRHASHELIAIPAGFDGDGFCIIEPAVTCNHCGYCKSVGH